MKDSVDKHHRRSIRLRGYDYAQAGVYFVTIVTKDRACLFGEVIDGGFQLNSVGEIVCACWREIPRHFSNVVADEFIVMPNHFHGVIFINVGARHAVPLPGSSERFGKPLPGSLPTIVGSFKAAVTKKINQLRCTPGATVWQRNYYEHIVRGENEIERIREYVANNPLHWAMDRENPFQSVDGRRKPVVSWEA